MCFHNVIAGEERRRIESSARCRIHVRYLPSAFFPLLRTPQYPLDFLETAAFRTPRRSSFRHFTQTPQLGHDMRVRHTPAADAQRVHWHEDSIFRPPRVSADFPPRPPAPTQLNASCIRYRGKKSVLLSSLYAAPRATAERDRSQK